MSINIDIIKKNIPCSLIYSNLKGHGASNLFFFFLVKSLNFNMSAFWCFMIWEIKSRMMICTQFRSWYTIDYHLLKILCAERIWFLSSVNRFRNVCISHNWKRNQTGGWKISLLLLHLVAIFGNAQCLKVNQPGILCINRYFNESLTYVNSPISECKFIVILLFSH